MGSTAQARPGTPAASYAHRPSSAGSARCTRCAASSSSAAVIQSSGGITESLLIPPIDDIDGDFEENVEEINDVDSEPDTPCVQCCNRGLAVVLFVLGMLILVSSTTTTIVKMVLPDKSAISEVCLTPLRPCKLF